MGNEESAQMMAQGGPGGGGGDPFGNRPPMNSMGGPGGGLSGPRGPGGGPGPGGFGQQQQPPGKPPSAANSVLNSIGQLSNSFPNSIKPMNQLINQLNPSSLTQGLTGGGGGGSGSGGGLGGLLGGGQQGQNRAGPGPGGGGGSGGPGMSSVHHLNQPHPHPNQPPPQSHHPSQHPASSTTSAPVPDVDLSGLTEEEKMMIQSVMARAQEETGGPGPGTGGPSGGKPPGMGLQQNNTNKAPGPMGQPNSVNQMASKSPPAPAIGYPEQRRGLSTAGAQQQQQPSTMANQQQQQQFSQQQQMQQQTNQMIKPMTTPCGGCQRELDHQSTIKCVDCGRIFCSQCTTSTIAPDGLSSVWNCLECASRRQQQQIAQQQQQQQENLMNTSGQMVGQQQQQPGMPNQPPQMGMNNPNSTAFPTQQQAQLPMGAPNSSSAFMPNQQQQPNVFTSQASSMSSNMNPASAPFDQQNQQLQQQQQFNAAGQPFSNDPLNQQSGPQQFPPNQQQKMLQGGQMSFENQQPQQQQQLPGQQSFDSSNLMMDQQQIDPIKANMGLGSSQFGQQQPEQQSLYGGAGSAGGPDMTGGMNGMPGNQPQNFGQRVPGTMNSGFQQPQHQNQLQQQQRQQSLDQTAAADPFAALSMPPAVSSAASNQQQQQQYPMGVPPGTQNSTLTQQQQQFLQQQGSLDSSGNLVYGNQQQQFGMQQQQQPVAAVVPRCKIILPDQQPQLYQGATPVPPSVLANTETATEADEYGYLDFEIDEDYEREGEAFEEDEEDEEEDNDEDEDDLDVDDLDEDEEISPEELAELEKLYGTAAATAAANSRRPSMQSGHVRRASTSVSSGSSRHHRKSISFSAQKSALKMNATDAAAAAQQQRALMLQQQQQKMLIGGGNVAGYYGPGGPFFHPVNEVYTIPEEDEDVHESEGEHHSSAGVSPRRQSGNVGGSSGGVSPASSVSGTSGSKALPTIPSGIVRHQLPDQTFVSSQQQHQNKQQMQPNQFQQQQQSQSHLQNQHFIQPTTSTGVYGPQQAQLPQSQFALNTENHVNNRVPNNPYQLPNNQFQQQQQQTSTIGNNMSKIFRVPGPIQRILPSNIPSSSSSSSSISTLPMANQSNNSGPYSSNPSSTSTSNANNSPMTRILNESTAKARSLRSNSEPFLQMIKPFRRGIFDNSSNAAAATTTAQQQQLQAANSGLAQISGQSGTQMSQQQLHPQQLQKQHPQPFQHSNINDSMLKQQQQQLQQQRSLSAQSSIESVNQLQQLQQQQQQNQMSDLVGMTSQEMALQGQPNLQQHLQADMSTRGLVSTTATSQSQFGPLGSSSSNNTITTSSLMGGAATSLGGLNQLNQNTQQTQQTLEQQRLLRQQHPLLQGLDQQQQQLLMLQTSTASQKTTANQAAATLKQTSLLTGQNLNQNANQHQLLNQALLSGGTLTSQQQQQFLQQQQNQLKLQTSLDQQQQQIQQLLQQSQPGSQQQQLLLQHQQLLNAQQEALNQTAGKPNLGSGAALLIDPVTGQILNETQLLLQNQQQIDPYSVMLARAAVANSSTSNSLINQLPYHNASLSSSSAGSSLGNTPSSGVFGPTITTTAIVSNGVITITGVGPTITTSSTAGRAQNLVSSQLTTPSLQPTSRLVQNQQLLNQTLLNQQQQQTQLTKNQLEQFSNNAWAHATELSPILDVSPSVEAAEAQEILERRSRSLENNRGNLDLNGLNGLTQLGIPRATSGTISAMMDDFNRAIETLDLNHNPDLMESTIRQNRAAAAAISSSSSASNRASSVDASKSRQSQLFQQQSGSGSGSQIARRASTGQVDSLDSMAALRADRASLVKQMQLKNTSLASTSSTTTSTASKTSSSQPMNQQQSGPETTTITTITGTVANTQNAENRQQTKALAAANSAIEAQLQKQQQILIQQQQQFLQLQLEQQRLQAVMHEQMERSAKQLEVQEKAETELLAAQQAQLAQLQAQQAQLQQSMAQATAKLAEAESVARNAATSARNAGREGGLAGGIYKVEHDLLYGNSQESRSGRSSGGSEMRTVLKSDKMVSTSTPPSINSTPMLGNRPGSGGAGGNRSLENDLARLRNSSGGMTTTTTTSVRRTLPQPMDDTPCPMPTSVTAYHHQQQKTGGTGLNSISANNSPLLSRRTALNQSAGVVTTSSAVTSSSSLMVKNAIGKAAAAMTAGSVPAPGATAVSSYPGSLLAGGGLRKDPQGRPLQGQQSVSQLMNTSLGYLDLDTKNVTFDVAGSSSSSAAGRRARRNLPAAPKEDDPIASSIATRRLIKERLISAGKGNRNAGQQQIRSSSSLDSSFGIGPYSGGNTAAQMAANKTRPGSPFSTTSDISQFLATTYGGRNLFNKSPPNASGVSGSGSGAALADALKSMISSKDARTASTGALLSRLASGDVADHLLGASSRAADAVTSSTVANNSAFANEIKHLQQKIIDELKTGVDPITVSSGPASQQLALFNSLAQKQLQGTSGGSAMSDPISGRASVIGGGIYGGPGPLRPASVTAYGGIAKSVGPMLTSSNANQQFDSSLSRRNFYNDFGGLSGSLGPAFREARLGSLERYMDRSKQHQLMSTGYGSLPFKSYEYESLNPVRNYADNSYRLMRPYSSVSYSAAAAAALAAENDLRESMIPNYMNRHLTTEADFLPRFEKDLLLDAAKYEQERSMNALYSKYDLATSTIGLGGGLGSSSAYERARSYSRSAGLYGRGQLGSSSRSWHPSPHASADLSDEEAALALADLPLTSSDQLSIEEKAAKVRAEIKRRRARLGDAAGRGLYRHYSLDDYNLMDSSALDSEYLTNSAAAAVDPLLDSAGNIALSDGYDLAISGHDYSTRGAGAGNLYPLSSATKEKYYSDDLDAYFSSKSAGGDGYSRVLGHSYGDTSYDRSSAAARAHNARLYDSRLSREPPYDGYGPPPMSFPPPPPMPHPQSSYSGGGPPPTHPSAMVGGPPGSLPPPQIRSGPGGYGSGGKPEDYGPAGINGTGYRTTAGYDLYSDYNYMRGSPKKTQFAPNTTKYPKYPFPIKRILLTQDPKIRSMGAGDGLGLKVVGGKDIPGTNMIGAYIERIHPSLSMNEIREGMQVIEWNGIPLTGISHDEVSRIIANQIGDEIEVVIRTDINLLSDMQQQQQQYGYGPPQQGGQMMPNYGPQGPPGQGPPYGPPQGPSYGPGPPQDSYDGGIPPPSAYNYGSQQHQQQPPHHMLSGGNQGMPGPPPQGGYPQPQRPPMMMGGASMHHGINPPQGMRSGQPQVILQHNHPVVDDSGYGLDHHQYGGGPHHQKTGQMGPPMGGPPPQGGGHLMPQQHQHQQQPGYHHQNLQSGPMQSSHPQHQQQQMDSGMYSGYQH